MSISLKTEALATKPLPNQHYCGEGNYTQRDQLLPIHGGKITPKIGCATKDLGNDLSHFLARPRQSSSGRLNPNFFMREMSVVGLTPSSSAAPPFPCIFH